jgi:endonuclease/exonuclease/phosphatase family metal-dependent hydrolase
VNTRSKTRLAISAGSLALAGCVSFPADRTGGCASAPVLEEKAGESSTTLSVLTYNVEGLPWPVKTGRGGRLREIARQLRAMREAGTAPDVVLLQEAFSDDAVRIGVRAGYRNFVRGPLARDKRPPSSEEAEPELVNRRKRRKGEGFTQIASSGLYILSDYPIVAVSRQPFRSRECAGSDCLSNKGLLHARIAVPGVTQPVELFNTHLQSRGNAGVSEERSLLAHRLQVDETSRFIQENRDPRLPLIFGGDFNMRNAPARFERFELRKPWPIVHQWCLAEAGACDVRLSWDGDTPWMDTQDLQGFDSGDRVKLRPIRVEAMFDEPWRGKPLADHDGFLTVYRLSWPRQASSPSPERAQAEGPCSRPVLTGTSRAELRSWPLPPALGRRERRARR